MCRVEYESDVPYGHEATRTMIIERNSTVLYVGKTDNGVVSDIGRKDARTLWHKNRSSGVIMEAGFHDIILFMNECSISVYIACRFGSVQ